MRLLNRVLLKVLFFQFWEAGPVAPPWQISFVSKWRFRLLSPFLTRGLFLFSPPPPRKGNLFACTSSCPLQPPDRGFRLLKPQVLPVGTRCFCAPAPRSLPNLFIRGSPLFCLRLGASPPVFLIGHFFFRKFGVLRLGNTLSWTPIPWSLPVRPPFSPCHTNLGP